MVRVDNFPFEEEEECRDASHPHQTVIRGFFYFAVVSFDFCVAVVVVVVVVVVDVVVVVVVVAVVVVVEDKVFTTR